MVLFLSFHAWTAPGVCLPWLPAGKIKNKHMKRSKLVVFVVGCSLVSSLSVAQTPGTKTPANLTEALEEIKALKARLGQLESAVANLAQTNPPPAQARVAPSTADAQAAK